VKFLLSGIFIFMFKGRFQKYKGARKILLVSGESVLKAKLEGIKV